MQRQAEPSSYDLTRFNDAAQGQRPFDEFDWFATDTEGHIALLSSGGFGPIPSIVFANPQTYFSASAHLDALPPRGQHRLLRQDGYNNTHWQEAAQRGLFAYDWDSSRAGQYVPDLPYELVAVPLKPIVLDDLPVAVADHVRLVRFPCRFGPDLFPQHLFSPINL